MRRRSRSWSRRSPRPRPPARAAPPLRIRSLVRVKTGARPSEKMRPGGDQEPEVVRPADPGAASRTRSPRGPGRRRSGRCGGRAARAGRSGWSRRRRPASPAASTAPPASGDRPSTSCRYCAMKTQLPNATKVASMYAASDALKAGYAEQARGRSAGSARVRCRRTNSEADGESRRDGDEWRPNRRRPAPPA